MSAIESSLERRRERSERLKQIAPDTAMGNYLRSFWYPIGAVTVLDEWPIKKVRLLGEDLALFRDDDGVYGLVSDTCPHRGASLACGMTDGPLIRCAYHGWAYDKSGQCVDTPAEPEASKLKTRIKIAGYPVEEMGGLLWAYLGKHPAPLLPRFEEVAREDRERSCSISELPCSWLACADNSLDPTHLEHLHMRHLNWVRARKGQPPVAVRKHAKFDFQLFPFGILKKRVWEGGSEDSDEWRIGHPLMFPATLRVPINADWVQFQFRVPVDEDHTMIYWYDSRAAKAGADTSRVPVVPNPWSDEAGEFVLDAINAQDMVMWITQGPSPDHLNEHLGEADRGIALFRKTIHEQLDCVERGEDPMFVIRDPAQNTPYLKIPIEKHGGYSMVLPRRVLASSAPNG